MLITITISSTLGNTVRLANLNGQIFLHLILQVGLTVNRTITATVKIAFPLRIGQVTLTAKVESIGMMMDALNHFHLHVKRMMKNTTHHQIPGQHMAGAAMDGPNLQEDVIAYLAVGKRREMTR